MKNFLTRALVALFCLAPVPVFAQAMVVTTCGTLNQNYTAGATRQATVDVTGKLCTNVTGAAGGTSATDNSVFTTGTTSVTPSGALYNDAATATSGNIAAPRMTSKRAQIVDVDTTGNALYTALTASVPACAASPCTTVIGAVVGYQGTTALSATNGWYFNQLQGNAVLSPTNPTFASSIPATSGGLSVYNIQPAASDNHAVIKAGAGQVYKVDVFNNSATVNYIRLYNATTGFNGCNSATNIVWQGIIPASTSGAGLSSSWDLGIAFATGISICVTSGYAQTDTTNATASALIVNVGYK